LAPIYLNDPTLLSIGGNTNGVNTFTGLDIGNLTGGVINGQNFLQGDNLACFCKLLLTLTPLRMKLVEICGDASLIANV
jgi:hypothetical protein